MENESTCSSKGNDDDAATGGGGWCVTLLLHVSASAAGEANGAKAEGRRSGTGRSEPFTDGDLPNDVFGTNGGIEGDVSTGFGRWVSRS